MKTQKLLLTESIEGLGIVGDVVSVKNGYARNYLLPRGFATKPTQGNIDRLAERRKQVEQEMILNRGSQEAMLSKIEDYELTIEHSANEQGILYGSVSVSQIAQGMRDAGFAIEDRAVRIGEQIKRLDSYIIPIQLATDLKTQIKLWVVSDKPMDELQTAQDGQDESQDEVGQESE
jgi:large subunit ribosomal protein L9